MLDVLEVEKVLSSILPSQTQQQIAHLAQFISSLTARTNIPSDQDRFSSYHPELESQLKILSGQQVQIGSSMVSFGAHSNIGDITIRDVVGRDNVTFNVTLQSTKSIKSCPDCGRDILTEARYCQCGKNLYQKCLSCNNDFLITHKRCDYCGVTVEENERKRK